MQIPQELTAGDLWSWTETLDDYPASLWTVTFYFRGPQFFSSQATASSNDHVVSIAAATTALLKPGIYDWHARAVLTATTTTVETVASGRLNVLPNLANQAIDHRSFNVRVTEALKATIEGRATTDQLSMSIAGRSLSRMSWEEILKAYDRFRLAAAAELGDQPSNLFIRFGRP